MDSERTRPLPQSFRAWLDLSADTEILTLLCLVVEVLERRGFRAVVHWRKAPEVR